MHAFQYTWDSELLARVEYRGSALGSKFLALGSSHGVHIERMCIYRGCTGGVTIHVALLLHFMNDDLQIQMYVYTYKSVPWYDNHGAFLREPIL